MIASERRSRLPRPELGAVTRQGDDVVGRRVFRGGHRAFLYDSRAAGAVPALDCRPSCCRSVERTIREHGLFDRGRSRAVRGVGRPRFDGAAAHPMGATRPAGAGAGGHDGRPWAAARGPRRGRSSSRPERATSGRWRSAGGRRAGRRGPPSPSSSPRVARVFRQDIARGLRLRALQAHARVIGARRDRARSPGRRSGRDGPVSRSCAAPACAGCPGFPIDANVRAATAGRERAQILTYIRRRSIAVRRGSLESGPALLARTAAPSGLARAARRDPHLGQAFGAGRRRRAPDRPSTEPRSCRRRAAAHRRAAAVVERLRRARGGNRRVDVAGAQAEISYGRVTWLRRAP